MNLAGSRRGVTGATSQADLAALRGYGKAAGE